MFLVHGNYSRFFITLYFIIVFDFSGNITGGVTPVPIPNTEVKSTEVDGTMVSRPWESRTLPVFLMPRGLLTAGHSSFPTEKFLFISY